MCRCFWCGPLYYTNSIRMKVATLLHPRVMKKAQEELDAVVGTHRMPDFEDFDSLPYVRAIVKETLRWVTPIRLTPAGRLTENAPLLLDGTHLPPLAYHMLSLRMMFTMACLYPLEALSLRTFSEHPHLVLLYWPEIWRSMIPVQLQETPRSG